jgi:hypothetical protein
MSDASETLRSVLSTSERCGSQLQAANITDAVFAIADALVEVAGAIVRSGTAIAYAVGKLADETCTANSWSNIADIAKALDRIADALDRRGD